jgi:hypothetical protein
VNIEPKGFETEPLQLSIYNLYGALLASFDMDHSNAMTLDVSNFSSGTYLLKAGNRTSIIATQPLISNRLIHSFSSIAHNLAMELYFYAKL